MKALILTSILSVSILYSHSQEDLIPMEMGTLDPRIDESSGLALASTNTFWTHNDRGGKAEIYEIDTRGKILRTVKLMGVEAVDFEDMAQDFQGHFFIGDFGNNNRDRQKEVIYRVASAEIDQDMVRPTAINFVLPDIGLNSKCHYDIESMFWYNDRLYLLTKDRCDKPDNHLVIYSLPDQPGNYTAIKEGIFNWEEPNKVVRISGADISRNGKNLVLITSDALHFFFDYKRGQFFNGSYRYIPLEKSKKEAVVHQDQCYLFFTEESKGDKPARIWKMNLCEIDFD